MELDRTRCRRANRARDRRFDGLFFCGVKTTGVYCRPICPVALPKPENVTYYPSAAACEEAGLRPCRRCRPETAPGTPAWRGSSTTVVRALRLIEERSPDAFGVEDLSERLGVGSRHLRRLFAEHLGASPLTVMRTRRVQLARRLVDETDLPIAEVAAASGFASIRQFNQTILDTFGKSPTALRRVIAGKRPQSDPGEIVFKLPFRPPLDWHGLLAFFRLRAIPGVECVTGDRYQRVIETGSGPGFIEVHDDPGSAQLILRVRIRDSIELGGCVDRTRRLFDLAANPVQIESDLRRDPSLAPRLAARPGIRVPGCWDAFELTIRAICGQQVSVRGATTLAGRLVARFGKPIDSVCGMPLSHTFPAPEALADADVASIGMPRARAAAIRECARAVASGQLDLSPAAGASDARARLREIPGIGDWTAQYVAMRALGDTDAFPHTDLGLIRALSDRRRISASALRARAEAWRPWRAYAAMCLWSQPG